MMLIVAEQQQSTFSNLIFCFIKAYQFFENIFYCIGYFTMNFLAIMMIFVFSFHGLAMDNSDSSDEFASGWLAFLGNQISSSLEENLPNQVPEESKISSTKRSREEGDKNPPHKIRRVMGEESNTFKKSRRCQIDFLLAAEKLERWLKEHPHCGGEDLIDIFADSVGTKSSKKYYANALYAVLLYIEEHGISSNTDLIPKVQGTVSLHSHAPIKTLLENKHIFESIINSGWNNNLY